ncbi:MASE1 protein [Pseudosporangium ferrugineum]|uniref:MASE1 protein n=2 Tax=Pseudosporangium ferrugineum TaxID=439699 RepID=A0A2T0RX23_9ACTN|nr:MASE1 protein [Pseudosporangium ferrugineum]
MPTCVRLMTGALSGRGPPSKLDPVRRVVLWVALGYTTGALLAWTLLGTADTAPVFFASAGVTSAALVLSRTGRWPAILLTVALIEVTVDVLHGWEFRFAAGFALANTAEPVLGAVLLRRYARSTPDLTRRPGVVAFVACCVLAGPLAGALIGATTVAVGRGAEWASLFLPFWAGDAVGVLTVGSAVLAWHGSRAGRRTGGLLLAALATSAVTVAGFWPLHVPLLFLPIPVLFWVAVRRGVPALTLSGVALAVTANVVSAAGRGPWRDLGDPWLAAATLQVFVAVTVLTAWALAVTAREREDERARAADFERDHEAAHRLQTALLPVLAERLPGVRAAGAYQPSEVRNEVGGDWYDVFRLGDGRIAFAVGDVVGHDLPAAVTMGRLQTALRVAARTSGSPAAVATVLDGVAADVPGAFCTSLGYGDYDGPSRMLRYVCAGHLPPLLLTATGVRFLTGGRGAPLGVRTRRAREEASLLVPAAATVVWYTDGLVERRAEHLDTGLKRLAEAAEQVRGETGPAAVRDHLMATLTAGGPLPDDVAVLCLHLP